MSLIKQQDIYQQNIDSFTNNLTSIDIENFGRSFMFSGSPGYDG